MKRHKANGGNLKPPPGGFGGALRGKTSTLITTFLFFLLLIVSGCGGGIDGNLPPPDREEAIAAQVPEDGLVYVSVRAAGARRTALLALDTGAPYTVLGRHLFLDRSPGVFTETRLEIGELVFNDAKVLILDFDACSPCEEAEPFDGLLGMDILGRYRLSIDYRGGKIFLQSPAATDSPPAEEETGAAASLDFELLGASRVVVRADLEGRGGWALADTGASLFTTRRGFFDLLPSRERPSFPGRALTSDCSLLKTELTRFAELSPSASGGAKASDLPGQVIDAWGVLDSISAETGREVEIILGGTYFRNFFTTFDFQRKKMILAPYREPKVDPEEFVGPSLIFRPEGCGLAVEEVFGGGDAEAAGVRPGDKVIEVDGLRWEELTADPFQRRSPGVKVSVVFERDGERIAADLVLYDRLPPLSGGLGGLIDLGYLSKGKIRHRRRPVRPPARKGPPSPWPARP